MTPDAEPVPPSRPGRLRRLWAWLARQPRVWIILGAIVLGGTAAVVAFGGYTVVDYTMNNPAFCRSCHIMETAWTRWASSEHRKVDCHECHQQSVAESARQVITFVLRHPERVGKHAEVPADRCRMCHASGNPTWLQIAQTAGHIVHAQNKGIQCVVCHSTSVHRIVPVVDICKNCHVAQAEGARRIKIAQMADFHCVDCHQFLREKSPLRPTRLTCLGCHAGLPVPARTVGWPAGAPMSSLACSTCHKPHEKAQPVVICTTCHPAPNPAIHPKETVAAGARSFTACTACHQPHSWKIR